MPYENTKNKSGDKRDVFLSAMSEKKIKVIGLTGVIGAGKSSVIAILKEIGITVIDCDRLNEQLQQPGEDGYRQIVKKFGKSILDDESNIDKAALGNIVFHDKERKKQLERIMHPLIQQRIIAEINRASGCLAVVEVPLLFEIHWDSFFDEIWVVACQKEILLERLASQRGISKEEAQLRLSHQMSQKEKIEKADHVLYNDTSRKDLKRQILEILRKE